MTHAFCFRFLLFIACTQATVALSPAAEYLVSDRATNQILRYDVTDGSGLGPLVNDDLATNGGLFLPSAMTYGFDNDLFVTSIDLDTGDGQVLRYDEHSGDFLGIFASGLIGPSGLFHHEASNSILVGSLGVGLGDSNVIARFAEDGTRMSDIAAGPISGRTGMTSGDRGEVYVSSFAEEPFFSGSVLKYDYDEVADTFTLGETFAAAAELAGANGVLFDDQGDMFVASLLGQAIVKFDVNGGQVVGSSVLANIAYPSGLLIDRDGNLLATSLGNNSPNDPIYDTVFPGSVFKYDPSTGAPVGMQPFLSGGAEFQPTTILLRPPSGDFNNDGRLDAEDIDALTAATNNNVMDMAFDLNGDGEVSSDDRRVWVTDLKETYFGDSNLDGEFNSGDLVFVFGLGEYEDGIDRNSKWEEGDWNGDEEFGSSDLVLAFQDGGYELGPRPALQVPEPHGSGLLFSALCTLSAARHGVRRLRR